MVILDKIGQPITQGSIIIYSHFFANHVGLRIGKVLAIEVKDDFNNQVVYNIKVRSINDDWKFYAPKLLAHSSIVHFPDRIVVLDENKLNPVLKTLLDKVQL